MNKSVKIDWRPFKSMRRIIKSSGRLVNTREYHGEPGVFYYAAGRAISGPFNIDDKRFGPVG